MTCREEILTAARRITKQSSRGEFTIQEIIDEMRACGSRFPDSTIRTHITARMCVNAPKHHAVTYDDLARVGRGRYRLITGAGGPPTGSPRRMMPSIPSRTRAAPTAGSVEEQIDKLIRHFEHYLEEFDARPAFTRPNQLPLHLEAVRRRRRLGSAAASIDSDRYLDYLWHALKAWGIGRRGSRLANLTDFRAAFRRQRVAIERLDGLMIDDANLDVRRTTRALWKLIHELQIVDNKTPLVAGSKALHHLLPDLVVPIDREYTRRFFGCWANRFQNKQEEFFASAFGQFASVACAVHPQSYVGTKWRSSRTKVLDNAIVAFCRVEEVPRYGG